MQMIKLIVYLGWSASFHSISLYNPFFPPLSSPVNYTTFLCWYLFWVFISFVLYLPFRWLKFRHFVLVVLLWSLEHCNIWYTSQFKVPINNITLTHPTQGVAPKCSGPPCLTLILANMPPVKRREGNFWACNICCILWDSIPLQVCWPTAWI